jgi:hypothetical protein
LIAVSTPMSIASCIDLSLLDRYMTMSD